VDEGRKRVIDIMAAIFASLHMRTAMICSALLKEVRELTNSCRKYPVGCPHHGEDRRAVLAPGAMTAVKLTLRAGV